MRKALFEDGHNGIEELDDALCSRTNLRFVCVICGSEMLGDIPGDLRQNRLEHECHRFGIDIAA